MSRIIGEKKSVDYVQNAKAGDKSVYLNLDAINELPDEFEVKITEVKYNPAKLAESFSDVGNGNFMPNPELMYDIAEARGISGGDMSDSGAIQEYVDINAMMMLPLDAEPHERKMTVGRFSRKYSTVIQEDGTLRRSSVCTSHYNVWERCCEAWSKEEMYSEGYTKPGKYPYKYDKPYKRKAHFDGEMKFAQAKAETKAHLKTIRELANLVTGFKREDLTSGSLYFARVQKSRGTLHAETAARLTALSKGIVPGTLEDASNNLFGSLPEITDVGHHSESIPNVTPKTNREIFIETLDAYTREQLIDSSMTETASKIRTWLENNPEAESSENWANAILRLKAMETMIDMVMRKDHGLYEKE